MSSNHNIPLHVVYNLDLIAKDARSRFSRRIRDKICLNQMKRQINKQITNQKVKLLKWYPMMGTASPACY